MELERVSCSLLTHVDESLCCFENNHWTRFDPVTSYFRAAIAEELKENDLLRWRPVVYLLTFVDAEQESQPLLYKYVGSTLNVGKRIMQHLESIWSGDSRKSGSLLMTSVGNKLLRHFGNLTFVKLRILKKDNLPWDRNELHVEEKDSMITERTFSLYGRGGLNIVDPVTYLYVLNGGVSLRHLQQLRVPDSWTCEDVVNDIIIPRTKRGRTSYHEYLETHEEACTKDAYRVLPDFFVGPTCNRCLWKDMLHYINSKSSTSKEVKEGDERPKFLHDAGDLYVHVNFLAMNLHKDRRPWPFPLEESRIK